MLVLEVETFARTFKPLGVLAPPALGGSLVLGALRLLQHPGDLRLVVAHELLRQAARLNQLAVGLLDCVIHQLKVCRSG